MAGDTVPIDLDALSAWLDSDQAPEDCMGLSDMDGFLTAIVIGPETVPTGEWLPVIWGGDSPEFASRAEMNTIMSAIMGRYDAITACFHADPDQFSPIFFEGPDGYTITTDWASGFLDAIILRRAAWAPMFEHHQAKQFLEPLLVLGDEGDFEGEYEASEMKQQFYGMKPEVISICIKGVHLFWEDQRLRRLPRPRRPGRQRR